jgi:hypothetical protein
MQQKKSYELKLTLFRYSSTEFKLSAKFKMPQGRDCVEGILLVENLILPVQTML